MRKRYEKDVDVSFQDIITVERLFKEGHAISLIAKKMDKTIYFVDRYVSRYLDNYKENIKGNKENNLISVE